MPDSVFDTINLRDDRLSANQAARERALQRAVASGRIGWSARYPIYDTVDEDRHASTFPRQDLPEFCKFHRPLTDEGAGNAGCWPHPWPACKSGKQAAVTTGRAETTGIPCAMVLTAASCSPWSA